VVGNIISIIANVALALSFIVALVFGIAQVRTAERDRRERFSLEALRNFQTREFAELLQYITSDRIPKSRKELNARPIEDQVIFIQLSQQMESLGLLVSVKLIDIELVDRTLGSFVTLAWEKYQPMFLDMRKDDPFIGEYFQWLAERIDQKMRENPRAPYYQNTTLIKP